MKQLSADSEEENSKAKESKDTKEKTKKDK